MGLESHGVSEGPGELSGLGYIYFHRSNLNS